MHKHPKCWLVPRSSLSGEEDGSNLAKSRLDKYFSRLLGHFVGAVVLCGLISWPLGPTFFHFLPSEGFYDFSSKAGVLFGIVVGFLIIYLNLFTDYYARYAGLDSEATPLNWLGFVLVGPFFVGLIAYMVVVISVPMALAVAVGENVELIYTVDETFSSERKRGKCPSKVTLEAIPELIGALCYVEESLLSTLRPGMKIALEGRGTENGFFYDSISIVD